jgi:citrate lyase subunit beta/citryl-CoA lyase
VTSTADARTFLFVPGDRPDRFGKAAASGADVVVLDLEDAVAPASKHAAREHVSRWLDERFPAVVRINSFGTAWHDADVAMVTTRPLAVAAVMMPKAEDRVALAALSARLHPPTGIIPLIETAAGVMEALSICCAPKVVRPAFGSLDLAAQLGVDPRERDALAYARSALVVAAAAAGCAAPIDGVTTSIADASALRDDLAYASALGFTGKLCIHPAQVADANVRLSPSEAETDWARGIIATAREGSVGVRDSQLVDRPVLLRAQAVLARAARIER